MDIFQANIVTGDCNVVDISTDNWLCAFFAEMGFTSHITASTTDGHTSLDVVFSRQIDINSVDVLECTWSYHKPVYWTTDSS